MMTKRAARYLRVSRSDQNPALQADETGRLIAGRGWDLVDTFLDHGVSASGAKDRRPELDRLMAAAKRGAFDVLHVTDSSPLARAA